MLTVTIRPRPVEQIQRAVHEALELDLPAAPPSDALSETSPDEL
jgi:hypothetical protein